MQHPHQFVEKSDRGVERRPVDRLSVGRLDHLEIPARKFVPEQLVYQHQRFGNAVFGEMLLDLTQRLLEHRVEPADCRGVAFALREAFVDRPAAYQTVSVPYFVAEVAALLAERIVEQQVVACGRAQQHGHAYAVGPVLRDQVERVGRVAERFAHLAAQLVADDSRQVDVAERAFAPVFVPGDDHPRHPEEQDVGSRDQVVGRIVVLDFLVIGAVDAVEYRDRPQPR